MNERMKRASSHRAINLLLEDWLALDRIAHVTESFATKGSRKGLRSWRALLRRIAQGEIVCMSAVVADELLKERERLRQRRKNSGIEVADVTVVAVEGIVDDQTPQTIIIKRKPGRPLTRRDLADAPR